MCLSGLTRRTVDRARSAFRVYPHTLQFGVRFMHALLTTGIVTLGLNARAYADAAPSVRVPASCGSQEEVASALHELLGPNAKLPAAALLSIEPDPGGVGFVLRIEAPDFNRELRDADCRALFRSGLVVLAATAQDNAAQRGEPANNAAQHGTDDVPVPLQRAPVRSDSDEHRAIANSFHAEAAIGGGPALGLAPAVAARFQLDVALLRDRVGIAAGAFYVAPSSMNSGPAQPGVRLQSLGVRLHALCRPERWLQLSLGPELAFVHAAGLSALRGGSGGAPALALAAEFTASLWHLGPVRLQLALAGQWNATRLSFEVRGYGGVYRMPAWGGFGQLRMAWSFF